MDIDTYFYSTGGTFHPVDACCRKLCFELLPCDVQEELYNKLMSCSTKEAEDTMLSGYLQWNEPK